MAVLDPEELFEQAEFLIIPRKPGPPRQVDVRRAVSAAYYGVFHFICAEVANLFIGKTLQKDPRYARVYRSVDHGALGSLCKAVSITKPDAALAAIAPKAGFSPALRRFAHAVAELKSQRHEADYDPSSLLRTANARIAIELGRQCLLAYSQAPAEEQAAFLTLLAFKAR